MSKTDYLTLLTEAHDFTVRHLHGGNTSYVTGLHLENMMMLVSGRHTVLYRRYSLNLALLMW